MFRMQGQRANRGLFHTDAISLNGTDEYLANTTAVTLGVADAWTLIHWISTSTVTGNDQLGDIIPASGNNNRFYMARFSAELLLQMFDSAGSEIKQWITTNSPFTADINTRIMVAATWVGNNTLIFYVNGAAVGAGDITETVDNTGTMDDTDTRKVYVGGSNAGTALWTGNMSVTALFNATLDASAINVLYNNGEGYKLDLRNPRGVYTETANLMHYWPHGRNSSDIGEDLGNAGTLIDIGDNASNVTAADIVTF